MTVLSIQKLVRRQALPPWQVVIYLVTYAGRGFYAPFVSIYLLSIGFTPVEIGFLTGVSALVRLAIVPVYSAWVDRRGIHRKLLTAQLLVTGGATLGMVFFTQKLWTGAMFMGRDSADIPGAALMGQLSITGAKERGSSMYGKLRAMGSLGWAGASFMSGTLIALGGYTLLIVLSGIAYLSVIPFLNTFPERTAAQNSRVDVPPKRLPAFWIIMASNLLFYVGMNAMSLFMFVYFKEYLGTDDSMVGVFAACLGLFEVPWMLGMNRIYRRVSTRNALMIGLAGQALFTLSLAFLTGTTLLFPLIAMRGFFYAIQNISLTLIVTEISHPANVATNQAITWVTMPALASILTGPLAGWMYENVGPRPLFILASLVIVVGALILVVWRRTIDTARHERLPLHVN